MLLSSQRSLLSMMKSQSLTTLEMPSLLHFSTCTLWLVPTRTDTRDVFLIGTILVQTLLCNCQGSHGNELQDGAQGSRRLGSDPKFTERGDTEKILEKHRKNTASCLVAFSVEVWSALALTGWSSIRLCPRDPGGCFGNVDFPAFPAKTWTQLLRSCYTRAIAGHGEAESDPRCGGHHPSSNLFSADFVNVAQSPFQQRRPTFWPSKCSYFFMSASCCAKGVGA